MSTWREQRRADKIADAEAQAMLLRARADSDRQHEAEQAHQRRQERNERQTRRDARRQVCAARLFAFRLWIAEHAAELLVYQLAVVSAAMAVPAMAKWGADTYGQATGALLPAITELGMWAFALAVSLRRRRAHGMSVQGLQIGVFAFAGVAAGTNFLHGLQRNGLVAGLVMAVVSVAGVAAHQLVTATGPSSRSERQRRRRTRRFERAAVAMAVGHVETSGSAELVVPAGTYRLTRVRPWRRRKLDRATLPGLPTAPVDELDRELADLLDDGASGHRADSCEAGSESTTGQVGLLDPDSTPRESPSSTTSSEPGDDLHESRLSRADRTTDTGPATGGRPGRSLEQLRAALQAAVETNSLDPTSAESIRRELNCGSKSARRLRDEWLHRIEQEGGENREQ